VHIARRRACTAGDFGFDMFFAPRQNGSGGTVSALTLRGSDSVAIFASKSVFLAMC
jgi:hypothetical protein